MGKILDKVEQAAEGIRRTVEDMAENAGILQRVNEDGTPSTPAPKKQAKPKAKKPAAAPRHHLPPRHAVRISPPRPKLRRR